MQPESPALLWDARRAGSLVLDFVHGRTIEEYVSDLLLKSAVERQLEILGEALNRLRHFDPETAAAIEDLPRIVAFRNILAHGYTSIDDRRVWDVVTTHVPVCGMSGYNPDFYGPM